MSEEADSYDESYSSYSSDTSEDEDTHFEPTANPFIDMEITQATLFDTSETTRAIIETSISDESLAVVWPDWEDTEAGEQLLMLETALQERLKESAHTSVKLFLIPHHTLAPGHSGPPSGLAIVFQVLPAMIESIPAMPEMLHETEMYRTLALSPVPLPEECNEKSLELYKAFAYGMPMRGKRLDDARLRRVFEEVQLSSPFGYVQVLCSRDRFDGHRIRLWLLVCDANVELSSRMYDHVLDASKNKLGMDSTFLAGRKYLSGARVGDEEPPDPRMEVLGSLQAELREARIRITDFERISTARANAQIRRFAVAWGMDENDLHPKDVRTWTTNCLRYLEDNSAFIYSSGVWMAHRVREIPVSERPDSAVFLLRGHPITGPEWSAPLIPFAHTFPCDTGRSLADSEITPEMLATCPPHVYEWKRPHEWNSTCVSTPTPCGVENKFRPRMGKARVFEGDHYGRTEMDETELSCLLTVFAPPPDEDDSFI